MQFKITWKMFQLHTNVEDVLINPAPLNQNNINQNNIRSRVHQYSGITLKL